MNKTSSIHVMMGRARLSALVLLLLSGSAQLGAQTLKWANPVNTTASSSNRGNAIARSATGSVYVAGCFAGSADFNPGQGTATFSTMNPNNSDAFLAKYQNNGSYVWAKKVLETRTDFLKTSAVSIATDRDGNIFLLGGGGGSDSGFALFHTGSAVDSIVGTFIYLAKYDSSGNYIWHRGIPARHANNHATPSSLAVSRSGEVYITGLFSDTLNLNPGGAGGIITAGNVNNYNRTNAFIAKYNRNGVFVWAGDMSGVGYSHGYGIALDTTDIEDKVYVTGQFTDTIDFDPGPGTAYLTGSTDMSKTSGFLARYDTAGHYVWAKGLIAGATGLSRLEAKSIAVDIQGHVLVSGAFMGTVDFDPGPGTNPLTTTGLLDAYLARYTENGDLIWAQAIGGTGGLAIAYALSLDPLGNPCITGTFGFAPVDFDPGSGTSLLTPGGFGDVFVAKYARTCGSLITAASLTGSGNSEAYPYSVTQDDDDGVYITGTFTGAVDFDPGSGSNMLSTTNINIYAAKLHMPPHGLPASHLDVALCGDTAYHMNGITYTESGTYRQLVPGTSSCDSLIILNLTITDISRPVISANGPSLSVTGIYTTYQWLKNGLPIPGAHTGTYTVTDNADYAVAVTKGDCADTSAIYSVTNVGISDKTTLAGQIRVYPNPTSAKLTIIAPIPVHAAICGIDGKTILEAGNARTISLDNLADGIYLLQIRDMDGRLIRYEKIIKQHE